MINEISRDTIFSVVKDRYPELLLFVKLLYEDPGMVFYKMADGSWQKTSMKEGGNQGYPLSSILAAMVLHEVLVSLTEKLLERAAERQRQGILYDDNAAGETHTTGFIDDCGAPVPLMGVLFFL